MRRIACLTTVLLLACFPAGALAATDFVVSGAGYGHGVGMSQWGAYGYARHGWGYRAILAHYYRGAALAATTAGNVSVLLESGRELTAYAFVREGGRSKPITYVATAQSSGYVLRDGQGHLFGSYSSPLGIASTTGSVRLAGTALNGVTDGAYRGEIEIAPAPSGGIDAINIVGLEDYVAGVVPSEMDASWPPAALEAQAVAARTYALTTDAGGSLFNEYPDTRSQVYRGLSGEQPAASAAVRATASEVLTYDGELATTYFFSASGGRTEDVQNVFYGDRPRPYLVSVDDPYDFYSPLHRWHLTFTPGAIALRLGGLCSGSFEALVPLREGVSGRIVSARVVCSRSARVASGVRLKAALGLYDTWFRVTRLTSYAVPGDSAPTLLTRLVAPRLALAGSVDPAPASGELVVEREAGGRFVPVATAATSATGDYAYALRGGGTYRVVDGASAGPAVDATVP